MANALRWSGYFSLITGIVIAIYLVSSLKVIDIDTINLVVEESAHPYRWLYAFFVLAVTTPIGFMSVAISGKFEEEGEFSAKARREEMAKYN